MYMEMKLDLNLMGMGTKYQEWVQGSTEFKSGYIIIINKAKIQV